MAAESKTKHYVNVFLRYFVLILVGLIMIYPLVWMVGATFKSNAEIFSSIGFIPKNPTLEGYIIPAAGSIERTAVHHVFQDGLGRFQVISPDHCADPVRDGYAVRIPADSVPAQRAEGIG